MNKLESLYNKKFYLETLIRESYMNGESRKRVERLENVLESVENEIDEENVRLYANSINMYIYKGGNDIWLN